MKNLLYTLLILGCAFGINAQAVGDITFTYEVDANSPTDMRKVNVFATSSAGTQTMTGFGFILYYNSAESTYNSGSTDYSGLTGMGWTIGSNTTVTDVAESNPNVPSTHDTKLEIAPLDENNTGSIIPNVSTFLFSITFDNTPGTADASDVFAGTSGNLNGPITNPSIVYTDETFSSFFINVDGTRQQNLPVKLQAFHALKFGDRGTMLDWTTSSEVNASHFEIERSDDGNNWDYLGEVTAKGESTQTVNYDFLDENVGLLRTNSTFYYRLKMLDRDGTFEYSEIRSVTFDVHGVSISTYPNPTSDVVKINMTSDQDISNNEAQAFVLDNTGKLLLKKEISSNGISEINLNTLPSGILMLQVKHNNKTYTHKIIKVD